MAKLNLSYYRGEDHYSDGDSEEERIISYIENTAPKDYTKIFKKDTSLPVFYHLSDARNSLLSWYDFGENKSVLEVGAGMGALTGILCERCAHVSAVELSRRRASAIYKRFQEKENLDIIVGDIADIDLPEKSYDYITVIGVLEHLCVFSDDPDVQVNFLKKLRKLLAPGGKLLLAIENKFGLKYWCGEVDDHSGIPFGTINDFAFGGKARTFDKKRLAAILEEGGFAKQKFYYPLPDYKLPRVVYSENHLPKLNVHASMHPIHYSNYYPYQPIMADEKKLYAPILQNGVFDFFANSFLVECAPDEESQMCTVDFASITVERTRSYQTCVRLKDGKYEKFAACTESEAHVRAMYENIETLRSRGLPVVDQEWHDNKIVLPNMDCDTLEDLFLRHIENEDSQGALEVLHMLWQIINKSSDEVPARKNAILHMDHLNADPTLPYGKILEWAYGDMLLSNCFFKDNRMYLYDQEWRFACLPANFILFCTLNVVYSSFPKVNQVLPLVDVQKKFGLTSLWETYQVVLTKLYTDMQDEGTCTVIGMLREQPECKIRENIELLKTGAHRLAQFEVTVNAQNQMLADKDNQITGRDTVIAEKDMQIAGRDTVIAEKDRQIAGREEVITEKDLQIAGREEVITEKDLQIAGRDTIIAEKDLQIAGRDTIIAEKDLQIAGRDTIIAEKDLQIAGRDTVIAEKDTQIAGRDTVIAEKDTQIAGRDMVIAEKDLQITDRDTAIAEKNLQIADRDRIIAEKDVQIGDMKNACQILESERNAIAEELNSYFASTLWGRIQNAYRCIWKNKRENK